MALVRHRGASRGGFRGRGASFAATAGHDANALFDTRQVGYGERLAAELRANPAQRAGAILSDTTLYSQARLPGDADCRVVLEETDRAHHLRQVGDPSVVRHVLCFTVPADFMQDNASTYVDYRLSTNEKICRHMRALSFFFHVMYGVAQLDRTRVNIYIEAIVRDIGTLPLVSGPAATHAMADYRAIPPQDIALERMNVTTPSNLAGYRIWLVLGTDSYGIETAIQRAIFRSQNVVNAHTALCSAEALEYKLAFSTIPNDNERRTAIANRADAEIRAERSHKRARPAAEAEREAVAAVTGDAVNAAEAAAVQEFIADGGSRDRDDRGENPEHTEAVARRAARIAEAISMPPAHSVRQTAMRYSADPSKQFLQIISNEDLLRHFIEPVLLAAGLEPTGLVSSEVLTAMANRWGECLTFGACVQGLQMLSIMDFYHSVLTLNCRQQRHDEACLEQTSIENYALDRGELVFPVPALVWEVATHRVDPTTMMHYAFPWTVSRYEEQKRRLRAAVQMADRSRAQRQAAVAGSARTGFNTTTLMTMPVMATRRSRASALDRAGLGETGMTHAMHAAMAQRLGRESVVADMSPREATACEVLREESLSMLAVGTGMHEARDPLQYSVAETDSLATTVSVTSDVTDLVKAHVTSWLETQTLLERMPAAAGLADTELRGVRAETERHFCALFAEEGMRRLMQALDKGRIVAHLHRTAFRVLSRSQTLERLVQSKPSYAPEKTSAAGMLVAIMEQQREALTLQHGHKELMENTSVLIIEAATPELKNANHTVLIGAPATAKSMVGEHVQEAALPGAVTESDVVTSRAEYAGKFISPAVVQSDEADSAMTDHRPESVAKNPEHARRKLQLTATRRNRQSFETDPETGETRTRSTAVEHTAVNTYNSNVAHFGGFGYTRPDTAIPSRVNYEFFLPWLRNVFAGSRRGAMPIAALNNLDASRLERLWRVTCERRHEETAFAIMLTLIFSTRICASFNMDCIDMIQNAAHTDIVEWWPEIATSFRLGARARQYGRALAITTLAHWLLSGDNSPLVEWHVIDQGDGTPVRHEPCVETFSMSDLPAVVGPHAYARVDHGLAAVARLCETYYQQQLYIVLRYIVSAQCGFTRTWMRAAYRRCFLPLIDDHVTRRNAERGLSPAALPSYIQYLLDTESMLDARVTEESGGILGAPGFAVCCMGVGGQGPDNNDGASDNHGLGREFEHTALGRNSLAGNDRAARVAQDHERLRGIDPNWLDTGRTLNEVVAAALPELSELIRIEEPQLQAILDKQAAHIRVRVPVFEQVATVALKGRPFDHANVIACYTKTLNNQSITFRTEPVIKLGRGYGRSYRTVWINTGALMVPPQYVMYLALTAFENEHTITREAVLPSLPMAHHAAYLTPHLVLPRQAGGRASTDNSCSATAMRRSRTANQLVSGQAIGLETVVKHTGATGDLELNQDLEDIAFDRHMRALRTMPPMADALYILEQIGVDVTPVRDAYWARHPYTENGAPAPPPPRAEMIRPTAAEVEQVQALWIRHHVANPRYLREHRDALHKDVPRLAPVSTATAPQECYPTTNIVDEDITHDFVKLARDRGVLPYTVAELDAQRAATRRRLDAAQARADAADPADAAAHEALDAARVMQTYMSYIEELCPNKPLAAPTALHQTLRLAKQAQQAAATIFCTEPAFSAHTRSLYLTPEWRPVLAAMLVRVCGATTCPTEAPRLSASYAEAARVLADVESPEGKALRAALPGWRSQAPSTVMLRWLERAYAMSDLLDSVVVTYATHATQPSGLIKAMYLIGELGTTAETAAAKLSAAQQEFALDTNNVDARRVLERFEAAGALALHIKATYAEQQRVHWNARASLERPPGAEPIAPAAHARTERAAATLDGRLATMASAASFGDRLAQIVSLHTNQPHVDRAATDSRAALRGSCAPPDPPATTTSGPAVATHVTA